MQVDYTRRKAVMGRSLKLGHCVCNPKQPCPCDNFRNFNICTCAGEKLPQTSDRISLLKYVKKAGCTSKIGLGDLKQILNRLPQFDNPRILIGASAGDDAGVFELIDGKCIVQTVDIFTPSVDDPFIYGQIAAANSLSDIYAMGGEPLTALSIVGFPIDDLPGTVLEDVLKGCIQKLKEAGCVLLGGHSMQSDEIFCGLSVTGLMDIKDVKARSNSKPGDVIILTKPLGNGMISFAAQLDRLEKRYLEQATSFMTMLNREPSLLMKKYGVNACTDVTGFGLLGHLVEMARDSRVVAEIDLAAVPVLEGVRFCLDNDLLPGGIERNLEYTSAWVRVHGNQDSKELSVLYDPQTSGGLLISIPETFARDFINELLNQNVIGASIIGKVIKPTDELPDGGVVIMNNQLNNIVTQNAEDKNYCKPVANLSVDKKEGANDQPCCCSNSGSQTNGGDQPCCASAPPRLDEGVKHGEDNLAQENFLKFMTVANQAGALDARTKKLIAISLSVAQRCEPCLKAHLSSAMAMGISKAEIDEAAWLGIAFSGAPSMMFYKQLSKEVYLK
jgi:selenide,water dikinase